MHVLHSLPSYLPYLRFSREGWIGVGVGFAVALAVMWLLVRAGRRRVIIDNSPAVDLMAYHLGRIADTLDRLSVEGQTPLRGLQRARQGAQAERETRESQQMQSAGPEPASEQRPVPSYRTGMSIFGR
jgi:hypothetical protein